MKDLKFRLIMDRSQSKAAANDHVADEKRMEGATKARVSAEKKANAEALTDQQVQSRAKIAFIQQENRERVAAAVADMKAKSAAGIAAAAAEATAKAAAAAEKKASEESAARWSKFTFAMSAAQVGLRIMMDLAGGFGAAMDKAYQKSKQMTDEFRSNRDKLGELATVMGEKPDNAFTVRHARFNVATGFREDEGLAYRMQFQNSGAQFKGRNISDAEYAEYEKQSGQLIAARGFDPSVSGDLAGSLLGFKDRTKLGAGASEDALGKLNSGTAILGRGKGRNNVLVNQFSMLSAASLNEDEMKGVFQDSDEVATVISTMAEKHDAQAAEMARAAIRGFRDFDGKAGDLLRKAGVDAKTKFVDVVKKLAPIVEAEAKAKGVKIEDVLKPAFEDQLTREAIAVAINKGVSGGIFEDRTNYARGMQGPAPALKAIEEYQGSERGMSRNADANVKLSETLRGSEDSRVDIVRRQAIADLIRTKQLDSTSQNFKDYVGGKASFGIFGDAERNRIDSAASALLNRRSPEGVGTGPGSRLSITPEARAADFNRQIDKIQAAGGDPFRDFVAVMQENNRMVARNNVLMEQQRAPAVATPPPVRQDRPAAPPTR